MTPNVYVFVISSLNHPIYRTIQQKRRRLLRHYHIPYSVLINHDESPLDDPREPTLVPLNDEEIMYNGGAWNPYMAQKFLMAVKMMFRSYQNYDEIPNYIVRINATVYVHYPSLLRILESKDFPRERVLAGPNWGNIFVQGMLMVFSKDVLLNMIGDPKIHSKELMRHNDDVSLSMLADPHSKWVDWSDHLVMSGEGITNDGIYDLDKIKPKENKKWMFRIREDEDNRRKDVENWDKLIQYFNEHDITTDPPADPFEVEKPDVYFPLITITVIVLVSFIIMLLLRQRYSRSSSVKRNRAISSF